MEQGNQNFGIIVLSILPIAKHLIMEVIVNVDTMLEQSTGICSMVLGGRGGREEVGAFQPFDKVFNSVPVR